MIQSTNEFLLILSFFIIKMYWIEIIKNYELK